MKAGLVANLAALAAIPRSAGITLRGRVAHSSPPRRTAASARSALSSAVTLGDAGIITEPTSGTLVTANAGALTFRIEVPRQGHPRSTRGDAGVAPINAHPPIARP